MVSYYGAFIYLEVKEEDKEVWRMVGVLINANFLDLAGAWACGDSFCMRKVGSVSVNCLC